MSSTITYSCIFYLFLIITTFPLQSCAPSRQTDSLNQTSSMKNIIPKPLFAEETGGFFKFNNQPVYINPELQPIGNYFAEEINHITGSNSRVIGLSNTEIMEEDELFILNIDENDVSLGEEGYVLKVTGRNILLTAHKPAGLFCGIQTIKQLLSIESANNKVEFPEWKVPAGIIRDHPRFRWRGAMLDVARHFFNVDDVKHYIDLLSYYKFNRFHIHLSDDQGWRIEIKSWPKLTSIGGSSSVNNEKPGYYTQEEYSEIVKYASERFITVIPEIDMPGHTHAALASYPELNCDDSLRQPYYGIDVGFSSLCIKKDITYKFIKDVVKEISALTPGEYFHMGGDEASSTDSSEYVQFVRDVQAIVNSNNKKMVGWEEIGQSDLKKSSVAQLWRSAYILNAVRQGSKVIMSPARKIYIDMKYDSTTTLGLKWAAYIEVKDAYDWDPANYVDGITEFDILGVEAPLWSETIKTIDDIEFLAFPRLPGVAEIGWSQKSNRSWDEYKVRLGNHGSILKTMGINFYKSPQVPWKE